MVNRTYCASSYLMYRTIVDHRMSFSERLEPRFYKRESNLEQIHNSQELEESLRRQVVEICSHSKAALALSGGIDSAILAKFMPKGSIAYTFKCIVPGLKVTDETEAAAKYAEACGLEHRVVEIYWDDFERYIVLLMQHHGMPIHSIEIQVYKAALQAKKDNLDCLIFGETADCIYGGHSELLSREWTFGEFVQRWSFALPYMILKDSEIILEPYKSYEHNGFINVPAFLSHFEILPSLSFYQNACEVAEITLFAPYSHTQMAIPLDLHKVRQGENKYMIREIFQKLYPNFTIPPKTPMPRPMNEWLKNWTGPERPEFWPHCTSHMTGDQKWLVWCLERFLNMIDVQE